MFSIQIVWYVTPCRLVSTLRRLEISHCLHLHGHEVVLGLLHAQDQVSAIFRNVGKYFPFETA
jgi:hypothetical protein